MKTISITFPDDFKSMGGFDLPIQSTFLEIQGVMAEPKHRRIIVDGSELSPEMNEKIIIAEIE